MSKSSRTLLSLPLGGAEHEPASEAAATRVGRYRFLVCALLFAVATINYVDRQVIGVLKPALERELHLTDIDYGNVVTAFQAAYALGMLGMGRLMDRWGTRRGFQVAVGIWCCAAALHGFARTVAGFALARFALGIGEAGMFPGALKTIGEWFPKRERALATGIFNSGTNVGAIVCPLIVPGLAVRYGFHAAFFATSTLGALWLLIWTLVYRPLADNTRVSPSERAYIEDGRAPRSAQVPWLVVLRHRETLAFALAKFMTDPFWWLYLFWLPDFLHRRHGLNLLELGPPLIVVYLLSDFGSVLGGFCSSRLIARGQSVNRARKTVLLAAALCVTPIVLSTRVESLWTAVALIGLATAAHQAFSANLFTVATDVFPASAVGSAVGIGGMAGAIGGMLLAQFAGHLLARTGSYALLFAAAASAYLAALALLQALSPRLTPIVLAASPSTVPRSAR